MKKYGFYGVIGSGKTTVSKYFSNEIGARYINADDVSKIVLDTEEVISYINENIPEAIEDGLINRSELRRILFNDKMVNYNFTNFMWPLIGSEIRKMIKNENKDIVVESMTLEPFKIAFDKIIRVDCSNYEEILKRVSDRDNRDIDETTSIINYQLEIIQNVIPDDVVDTFNKNWKVGLLDKIKAR